MAKVVLPLGRDGGPLPLPPVCMRCGAPATHTLKMQFFEKGSSQVPGEEGDFVIVDAPLCGRHPFMGQAKWMILFGFLLLLPMIGVAALCDRWVHRYVFVFPVIAYVFAVIALVAFASLSSL